MHTMDRIGFRPRPKAERELLRYLRRHQGPTLQAALGQLVDDVAPAVCWAQRRVLLVVLTRTLLAPAATGHHVELGRHHLAAQAGVRSLVTVTRALSVLRGRWIHNPVHGRHQQGCSVYAPTRALVQAAADRVAALAASARSRGYRNHLAANSSRSQRIFGGRKDTHVSGLRAAPPPPPPADGQLAVDPATRAGFMAQIRQALDRRQ